MSYWVGLLCTLSVSVTHSQSMQVVTERRRCAPASSAMSFILELFRMYQSQKQLSDIDEQRDAVVSEAMTWLRTPYHHLARVKGHGVDCAQILIAVYSACGIVEDFKTEEYSKDWMLHQNEERYMAWVNKYTIKVDTPKRGDIALFRFGRTASHGAIIVNWPTIIHAYSQEGQVTISDASMGELAPRFESFHSVWKDS